MIKGKLIKIIVESKIIFLKNYWFESSKSYKFNELMGSIQYAKNGVR